MVGLRSYIPTSTRHSQFDGTSESRAIRSHIQEVSLVLPSPSLYRKHQPLTGCNRLPDFQEDLQKLLNTTEESLRKLPKPPSQDSLADILHLVSEFSRDLGRHCEGTPDEDGLLQAIRPAQNRFQEAIRSTAPQFVPRTKKSSASLTPEEQNPSFLSSEEATGRSGVNPPNKPIWIDEVLHKANRCVKVDPGVL